MVLDISNMFRFVNKDFIVENKLSLIQSHCKNDLSQLRTIDSDGILTYRDPYMLTLDLHGFDKKKNPAKCKITFDMRNDWNVTNAQYN